MLKNRFVIVAILIGLALLTQYIVFSYPISSGKRIGNLTRLAMRGKILKTWEGTLNSGYGDKLTLYFSISDQDLAKQLYAYEGREVIIYYEEYLSGWPRETKYNITKWEPQEVQSVENGTGKDGAMVKELSKTLFCTLLGTLKSNDELYQKVKSHIQQNNYYLYKQYERCNE